MGDSDSWWIAGESSDCLDTQTLSRTHTHTHKPAGGLIVAVWTLTPPTATYRGGAHLSPVSPPPSVLNTRGPRGCFFFLFVFLFLRLRCVSADHWTELKWCGGITEKAGVGGLRHRPPARTDVACKWPLAAPKPTLSVLYCTHLQVPVSHPRPSSILPYIATWRKPCRCIYWHLYKCTYLRKKMKSWHICNLQVLLSLLNPITKHTFSSSSSSFFCFESPTKRNIFPP